jgi:hypothetical protein
MKRHVPDDQDLTKQKRTRLHDDLSSVRGHIAERRRQQDRLREHYDKASRNFISTLDRLRNEAGESSSEFKMVHERYFWHRDKYEHEHATLAGSMDCLKAREQTIKMQIDLTRFEDTLVQKFQLLESKIQEVQVTKDEESRQENDLKSQSGSTDELLTLHNLRVGTNEQKREVLAVFVNQLNGLLNSASEISHTKSTKKTAIRGAIRLVKHLDLFIRLARHPDVKNIQYNAFQCIIAFSAVPKLRPQICSSTALLELIVNGIKRENNPGIKVSCIRLLQELTEIIPEQENNAFHPELPRILPRVPWFTWNEETGDCNYICKGCYLIGHCNSIASCRGSLIGHLTPKPNGKITCMQRFGKAGELFKEMQKEYDSLAVKDIDELLKERRNADDE